MLLEDFHHKILTYNAVNISVPIIEKTRFLNLIEELSSSLSARFETWNILQIRDSRFEQDRSNNIDSVIDSIENTIANIKNTRETSILLLENFHGFLDCSRVDFTTAAYLREAIVNTVFEFKQLSNKYLVLLDTEDNLLPSSISKIVPTIDYALPTTEEVAQYLSLTLKLNGYVVDKALVERAAIASLGLSLEEVSLGLSSALLDSAMVLENPPKQRGYRIAEINNVKSLLGNDLEPIIDANPVPDDFIDRLVNYKKSRLRQSGLEFMPPPDVADFGGLDRLKAAIVRVKQDFSPQAREFNLPIPRGWLLVGPPGTGKTFSAKVCASLLGFPLISIGVDSVLAGGASYLKKLLLRIDAVGGAIGYFDEFDKFFADINNSRTKEVLGVLLTWLAEKTSSTFVMATLNRFDNLPAELTRAGRFDRIWYVDFPHATERYHIFTIHLSRFDCRYGIVNGEVKSPLTFRDWQVLLNQTNNFTGAEIRAMVEDAARDCFYNGKNEIHLGDLLAVCKQMTSLFARDPESICAMANRAKKHSTPASSPDTGLFAPIEENFWGEKVASL